MKKRKFWFFFLAAAAVLLTGTLLGIADERIREIKGEGDGQAVFSVQNRKEEAKADLTVFGKKYQLNYEGAAVFGEKVEETLSVFSPLWKTPQAILRDLRERLTPSFDRHNNQRTVRVPKVF